VGRSPFFGNGNVASFFVRVPLPLIAKILGGTAGTMVRMAGGYGHFGIEELRGAVEAISRNGAEIETGYPQFSPQSGIPNDGERAN